MYFISFINLDFVNCKIIAKFIYNYFFQIANSLVSWKFKQATIIALFTLEAEFIGLVESNKEVL